MFTTYQEAKVYLESFIPTSSQARRAYQLDRMREFVALLGDPQIRYPTIHVGGTSGKGSTATFAATILKELGFKVGLHLSPHLQYLGERIQINNQPISPPQLIRLLNEVVPAVAQLKHSRNDPPTYFEILVVMSFLYFAQEKVDAAVIEVGLGGTLDGTNIIPPSLAILTNVSLDHTAILGKTVTRIATDKMGIIKRDAPAVVSGFTQPQLQHQLETCCRQSNVPLHLLNRDFGLRTETPALAGGFQKTNFSLAAKAAEIFVNKYFPQHSVVLNKAIKNAALTAFIPGRLEKVQKNPLVILDGAHNKAKMSALVDSLKTLYPKQKWLVVLALKKDKSPKSVLNQLQPITRQFIFSRFSQNQDSGTGISFAPAELKSATKTSSVIESDPLKAVKRAILLAKKTHQVVLVTGSLYLVGEVRNLWYPKPVNWSKKGTHAQRKNSSSFMKTQL